MSLDNIQSKRIDKLGPIEGVQRLKPSSFPRKESFASFSDFFIYVKNMVDVVLRQGYNRETLANDLVICISTQPDIGPSFLHAMKQVKTVDPCTVEDILKHLEESDFEHMHMTPEERFKATKRGPREGIQAFMQRLEQAFDAAHEHSVDPLKRLIEIKRIFLENGNLPVYLQEKLMPFSSLRELAFAATGMLERDRNGQDRRNSCSRFEGDSNFHGHPVGDFNEAFWDQVQTVGQNNVQQSVTPLQHKQRNVVTVGPERLQQPSLHIFKTKSGHTSFRPPPDEKLSAPGNAKRMPASADLDPLLRFSFCSHCRLTEPPHPSQVCFYQPFCSYCNVEGSHENRRCADRGSQS